MKIKIIYRKLGKEKAHGIAYSDGVIELDSRLKGRKRLEITIHEILHLLNPEDEEEEIIRKSVTLTKLLWSDGFRRIEKSTIEPYQDGTK